MRLATDWRHFFITSTFLLFCNLALGGNGLKDVASGMQSAGLAGADLVLTNSTSAVNINPAGLSRIEESQLDMWLEPAFYDSYHKDSISGKTRLENDSILAFGNGYARRLNSRWVAGVGVFFLGGAGYEYEDLANALGPPDNLGGSFGSLTITPGVSWQVNERLTLGAAFSLIYSSAEQNVFPNISTPEFQGFRVRDLEGISTNFRLGMLYTISPQWTIGASYANEAPITLQDGTLRINRSGTGKDPLTYRDVTFKGLNFSEEFSAGIAYRPTSRWSIAMDLTWSKWAYSMRTSRLQASNPDDPTAPSVLNIVTPLNWRDQLLVALGTEYQWSRDTTLRTGVSYGRIPQQDDGLNPSNSVLADLTIASGFTRQLGSKWEASGAVIWQPQSTEKYDNPIFGGASSETWGVVAFYLGVSRKW